VQQCTDDEIAKKLLEPKSKRFKRKSRRALPKQRCDGGSAKMARTEAVASAQSSASTSHPASSSLGDRIINPKNTDAKSSPPNADAQSSPNNAELLLAQNRNLCHPTYPCLGFSGEEFEAAIKHSMASFLMTVPLNANIAIPTEFPLLAGKKMEFTVIFDRNNKSRPFCIFKAGENPCHKQREPQRKYCPACSKSATSLRQFAAYLKNKAE